MEGCFFPELKAGIVQEDMLRGAAESRDVPTEIALAGSLASPMVIATVLRVTISTATGPAKGFRAVAIELSSIGE